jgi:hypothetical protein
MFQPSGVAMYYVQFFQASAYPVGSTELIEACGDRSVVILDGRMSLPAMHRIAAAECVKRGYLAWQLFMGEAFTRSCSIGVIHHA